MWRAPIRTQGREDEPLLAAAEVAVGQEGRSERFGQTQRERLGRGRRQRRGAARVGCGGQRRFGRADALAAASELALPGLVEDGARSRIEIGIDRPGLESRRAARQRGGEDGGEDGERTRSGRTHEAGLDVGAARIFLRRMGAARAAFQAGYRSGLRSSRLDTLQSAGSGGIRSASWRPFTRILDCDRSLLRARGINGNVGVASASRPLNMAGFRKGRRPQSVTAHVCHRVADLPRQSRGSRLSRTLGGSAFEEKPAKRHVLHGEAQAPRSAHRRAARAREGDRSRGSAGAAQGRRSREGKGHRRRRESSWSRTPAPGPRPRRKVRTSARSRCSNGALTS